MAFNSLNKDELEKVAEFFNKDVVTADEENGPTKKELVAALESGDPEAEADGDKPVTWEDYKDIYLAAQETGQVEVKNNAPELTDVPEPEAVEEEEDDTPKILVKMDRKNPRFDIRGYTFSKDHPFHSVDEKTAEYLVRNVEGFRLAMPSEVADFYN